MAGNARITQEYVEVLGPITPGHARITQETVEALGSIDTSLARITQETVEVLGYDSTSHARITQEYVEVLGPYGASSSFARITQMVAEILGPYPILTACTIPEPISFTGNVSGVFYTMRDMGAETVPVGFIDSSVIVSIAGDVNVGQQLTEDGTWIEWHPEGGALEVSLSNGLPVRTLWVVTNQARSTPPIIPVYASSLIMPLWKQLCSPG